MIHRESPLHPSDGLTAVESRAALNLLEAQATREIVAPAFGFGQPHEANLGALDALTLVVHDDDIEARCRANADLADVDGLAGAHFTDGNPDVFESPARRDDLDGASGDAPELEFGAVDLEGAAAQPAEPEAGERRAGAGADEPAGDAGGLRLR